MKTINHTAETRIRFDGFAAPRSAAADSDIAHAAIRLQASRQRRDAYFDAPLFRDPAWDIMLDLFIAQCRGARPSLACVHVVAGVPRATALRIVQYLAKTGLVEQSGDPLYPDSLCLKLTAEGDRGMRGFLAGEAAA